tara:strand:- start:567 stop:845 length:279 start_codon:yes stop_codon:yes gene_type:complete
LKDVWVLLWSKTEVDEKAIATLKEVQKRYKLTAQEIEDVATAMKEVANQIDDIPNALKGNVRKGRKTKSLGKMTMSKKKEDPYYKNSKKLNK